MIRSILFDLDDTLLGNDMDTFLGSYFPLLAKHMSALIDSDLFIRELIIATQRAIADHDPITTVQEVFWEVFSQRTGLGKEEMSPTLDQFYEEAFPSLQSVTSKRPVARHIVKSCIDKGLNVVIATNPLFPLAAIEQRMNWAGVGVNEFDYSLVTAYENMHATKPHQAYYNEILGVIDCEPPEALMVGDDWNNDIVPTHQMGLRTFWISDETADRPGSTITPDEAGSLESLNNLIQDGWLENLLPPTSAPPQI